MLAFRYMPRRFAEAAIEFGHLRLGTTEAMGRLEALADPLDSGVKWQDELHHIDGPLSPAERERYKRLGVGFGDDFSGSNIRVSGTRTLQLKGYVLCCTDTAINQHLFLEAPQNDTVLKIADLRELESRLTSYDARLRAISEEPRPPEHTRVALGRVGYAPREGDSTAGFDADPFTKALRFQPERELRVVWAPTKPPAGPLDVTVPEIRELLNIV